ncbi:MAG: peptide deformylase [Clostridia bacterium]|nr:peptide deformylase [Clostridia bacterium]
MAVRSIRTDGDEVLRKVCKVVDTIDNRVLTLLDDMAETMYKADGVGLAAPQIGILKRIAVIDVGEGLIELINPKIISESGEQLEVEGCLSIPNVQGEVKRPEKVVVEALDRQGEKFVIEGTGLLAIALCHEIDHLDGVLFKDKVVRFINKEDLANRK